MKQTIFAYDGIVMENCNSVFISDMFNVCGDIVLSGNHKIFSLITGQLTPGKVPRQID